MRKTGKSPGRPTRDHAKRRDVELLDKALDLFLEKGFERTSIDAITASVGMAKRTVYLRYPDKTALFKAAIQRAIEDWIVPLERLRAAEVADLTQSLLRIGEILVENIMNPAGLRLMRITNAESGRLPEIGVYAYKQGTDRTVAYLADLFRRRVKPREVQSFDPEEAAQGFLYLVVGGPASMTAWGLTLEKSEIDRHTRDCVRLFLYGLLPREERASSATSRTLPSHVDQPALASGTTGAALSDARRLTALEDENRRLKILLADAMLESAAHKELREEGD